MEGRVIWSKKSDDYLERTFMFIAKDSKVYAERFVTDLILYTEDYFNQDVAHGRKIPEFEDTQLAFLKEIIYRGYRIIYDDSYEKNKIYIVLVINGRQSINKHI
jgi:plasmid stabilization system protein ParE